MIDRAEHNRRRKERYDRKKAAGECVRCDRPARPGVTLCDGCSAIQEKSSHRWFDRIRVEQPERAAKIRRTARNNWRRKQIALGHCVDCVESAVRASRCQKHYDMDCARRAKRSSRRPIKNDRRTWVPPLAPPHPVCLECGTNEPMTESAICWCCTNRAAA